MLATHGTELYLYRYRWGSRYNRFVPHKFIFRSDPVPFLSIKSAPYNWKSYYKNPKVLQEKRLFYKYKKYVRLKRRPVNLPNTYDDIDRGDIKTRKSWKNKKIRKQWMKHKVC